ncbi:recombinase family protein [Streptomyces sp. NPDC048516]|uniref:recombinase family protein n=1 Tax=Streptomyces sp. NPDC048516 TaxID=3365565 RepID=UPI003712F7AA
MRISSDRFGLEAGVDRQLEDAEDTRVRLQWGPLAKVYRENDTSAFKKRKAVKPDGSIDWTVLRPEFRQLLADLANGVIVGVIFYDLDRLVRRPRDLVSFLNKQLQTSKTGLDQSAGTIAALQARLDQELARKSELIHRWSNERALHEVDLSEGDYFTMLAALNRKISRLRESIAGLEGAPPPRAASEDLLANWTAGHEDARSRGVGRTSLACALPVGACRGGGQSTSYP